MTTPVPYAEFIARRRARVVFSAFAGVGSELHVAVRLGRRARGIELKPSYWRTACQYLHELEAEIAAPKLTDLLTAEDSSS
ncbi:MULTISPECIES: hypothetical protein [unclassified Microbacterium]|uniref:hypothetical protein n=1 Tax=unclassified Microbacterium TaxID=2609290 RepID=UPI000DE342AC|nr:MULTISPECIES: hypothetical protein [unclassified Microbacterium]NYF29048.1 DNA modification methylase [Microbacterium sp. JAI119]RBO72829.1 hypothetical protein DSP71_08875 [Microbacterium sp. H6]